MFDVGFWELALISVVALVIIGPDKLPGFARTVGLYVGKARRMMREVKADINRELREHDLADLGEIKKDLQSAGEEIKKVGTEVKETVDTDSLKKTFEDAAPMKKEELSGIADDLRETVDAVDAPDDTGDGSDTAASSKAATGGKAAPAAASAAKLSRKQDSAAAADAKPQTDETADRT